MSERISHFRESLKDKEELGEMFHKAVEVVVGSDALNTEEKELILKHLLAAYVGVEITRLVDMYISPIALVRLVSQP